jgi:hypothetical protein
VVRVELQDPAAPSAAAQPTDCWSGAFSASSRLFDLNGEINSASTKHNSATIVVDDTANLVLT